MYESKTTNHNFSLESIMKTKLILLRKMLFKAKNSFLTVSRHMWHFSGFSIFFSPFKAAFDWLIFILDKFVIIIVAVYSRLFS